MEHFYHSLEGRSCRPIWDFYRSQVEQASDAPSHFVEVGAFFGQSVAFLAVEIINSGKPIRLDCVDPWMEIPEDSGDISVGQRLRAAFPTPDAFFAGFLKNVRSVMPPIVPIRLPSVVAASVYLDASLDLVFIDGLHDQESVKSDVAAWLPKVKTGGVISGDDYQYASVQEGTRALRHQITTDADGRVWSLRVER